MPNDFRQDDCVTVDSDFDVPEAEWDSDRTNEDLLQEADDLALRVGCASRVELFERCDRGDFAGSILESKVAMIRFLLAEDVQPAAAE